METIRVNMTPCEDIKTIHASQNDNEGREWGFILHNNGDVIDSSEITDQMVFKAYEGGTEQILPENGAVPVTAPFVGDIKYPDATRTDQEFLYRQSPTEEDGLAKITDIKGNTLVWNQIFIPYGRTGSGIQSNVIQDGNDYSMRIYGTATASAWLRMDSIGVLPVGHKFLLDKGSTSNLFDINNDNNGLNVDFSVKTKIGTVTTANKYIYIFVGSGTTIDVTVKPMLIDLTAMFGAGNEPTSVEEFTSLFSLPYYAYNQGTLLSFNGNGIKTVGKNQVANVVRGYFSVGASAISVDNDSESFVFYAIKGKTYVSSSAVTLNRNAIARCDTPNLVNGSPIYDIVNTSRTWTATWTGWAVWYVYSSKNEVVENSAQVEFGTTPTSYEPYTSSTLSLPISTYFPTGMKSAGTVYDELTPTKATTRIGVVDLGTLTWNYNSTNAYFTTNEISSLYKVPSSNLTVANIIDQKHTTISANDLVSGGQLGIAIRTNGTLMVRDTNYTDATAFKTAMSGVYLYYELATPTEVTFSTASLVTENAEIPLSNEDGVLIGKCTEELSSESGFFDAKIKLADEDGECYSNKIQLHIERSPQ